MKKTAALLVGLLFLVTTATAVAPTYDSLTITGGNTVRLTFCEDVYWLTALDDTTHLIVTVGGAGRTATQVAIRPKGSNNATMDITYSGAAIADGQTVSVEITNAAATTIIESEGDVFMAAGATQSATYNAPPTVVSAATDMSGSKITITFSKTMADPAGKHAQFGYQINGGADQTFSAAALNADTKQINLTTSGTAIASGDVITVNYTAGTVAAADTGVLASFKDKAVTNNFATTPVAGFSAIPLGGPVPVSVQFTDTSTNSPTSWSWDFGDGTTSSAQNPSHYYGVVGVYTVKLTATNAAGSNTKTQTGYITITAASPQQTGTAGDSTGTSAGSVQAGNVGGTQGNTPAGGTATLTFNQVTSPESPVGVTQLQIVPGREIGTFQVVARPVEVGDALKVQDVPVAGYLEIQLIGINPSAIDHATITFAVDGAWLAANNVNPSQVVLMTSQGNEWVSLPTQFSSQTGNTYYFTSAATHFSLFAIVAVKDREVETAGPVQTIAPKETSIQTFGDLMPVEETTQIPAKSIIIVRTTDGAVVQPATVPEGGIPYFLILIISACVIVIAGAFSMKRWRQ